MYKHSLNPDTYKQIQPTGITRANAKIRFELPMPTVERYKYFPLYYGSQIWDRLTPQDQKSESYLSFKNKLPKEPNFTIYPV